VSNSGSVVWLWWSVAAVAPECGSWISGPTLGVWMLSVVMKRLCRIASCLRLSAEKPPGTRECYGYHSLSHWSALAFSLIQRSCSENRTLSASVTLPRGLLCKFKIKGTMAFSPGANTNYIFCTKKYPFRTLVLPVGLRLQEGREAGGTQG